MSQQRSVNSIIQSLDLAPTRKTPLSLLNPLDYCYLLYWVFFFPQAIVWYIKTFASKDYQRLNGVFPLVKGLQADLVQGKLVVQSIILVAVILSLSAIGVGSLGWFVADEHWLLTITIGLAGFIGFMVALGVAEGIVVGVSFSVLYGVIGAVWLDLQIPFIDFYLRAALLVLVSFTAAGMRCTAIRFRYRAFELHLTEALLCYGFVNLLYLYAIYFIKIFTIDIITIAIAIFALLFFFIVLYILIFTPIRFFLANNLGYYHLLRFSYWPIGLITHQLINDLCRVADKDWPGYLKLINNLYFYSTAHIPLRAAIIRVIERQSNQLQVVKSLDVIRSLEDSLFLYFISADLEKRALFLPVIINNWPFKWLPKSIEKRKQRYAPTINIDNPVQAIFAGFYYWHQQQLSQARQAFATVKEYPNGQELYGLAFNMEVSFSVQSLDDIAKLAFVDFGNDTVIRTSSVEVVKQLQNIIDDALMILEGRSLVNKSIALNRCTAQLNDIMQSDSLLRPEGLCLKNIATNWQQIILQHSKSIGQSLAHKPCINPYQGYSGLPIYGEQFIGRNHILSRIEQLVSTPGLMPVLVIYGHRRMGKSSVLKQLAYLQGAANAHVYIDMQITGADSEAELLLEFAELIYEQLTEKNSALMIKLPELDEDDYTSFRQGKTAFKRLIATVLDALQGRRLLLAIDEFELIEDGIHKQYYDPRILQFLRALNIQFTHLSFIFGGLHTLEQMGKDYQSAFFGQCEHIKISYFTQSEARTLMTQPDLEFSLEYESEVVDEVFTLTGGQPYLLQRLCWELVNEWNNQFSDCVARQTDLPERMVKLSHLHACINEEFFTNADYYFSGVWQQLTENERLCLQQLMVSEQGMTRAELENQGVVDLDATSEQLFQHDMIVIDQKIRFKSQLFRQWMQLSAF